MTDPWANHRQRERPRTPYQREVRVWVDTLTEMNERSAVAGPHVQFAWRGLWIRLMASCPKKRVLRDDHITPATVETAALALVSEHQKRCDCRDYDWTWLTNPKQEEA
jgi:hypothetical protein